MGSPLGRYSDVAAAVVGVAVVLAWLLVHVALVLAPNLTEGRPLDTSSLDLAATFVLGVVLGQRATTNGASIVAHGANLRLDAIGAPSAGAAAAAMAGQPARAPLAMADDAPAHLAGPPDA